MSIDPRFATPAPFTRLLRAHAVAVAGDACITVSLAGSLFFQNPTSAARGQVLLYLLLTMAPFAVVAPILGPALDRSRGGRRLLIAVSAGGRAVLCFAMALAITKPSPEGLLVYPLAFGVLVLAKGHQIAKSALVPALVKSETELVSANSRLALLSVIAATVGGIPAAGIQQLFGADWSLRVAGVVFIVATVLSFKIPAASSARAPDAQRDQLAAAELHQPSILLAGSAMAALRCGVGFLAFFAAFSLKDDLFALGCALAASAAGGFIGVLAAPALRRSVREEVIIAGSLVLPAAFALFGALAGGSTGFVISAFFLAVGAAAGRLGFDSVLQRDGPDAVRGRSFARFETRFQMVWVIGGVLGIIPIAEEVGLFVLAAGLGFAAISYVAAIRATQRTMRSKLLPEAVDRALARSRASATASLRARWRRRDPSVDTGVPAEHPPAEHPPGELPPGGVAEPGASDGQPDVTPSDER